MIIVMIEYVSSNIIIKNQMLQTGGFDEPATYKNLNLAYI